MGKSLSVQDAWDMLADDQRQFERTVATLKAMVLDLSKNQGSVDKTSTEQDLSRNIR